MGIMGMAPVPMMTRFVLESGHGIFGLKLWISVGIGIYYLSFMATASAAEWKINPSLNVREIYSDNVVLSSTAKDREFVTEITPGIAINHEGSIGQLFGSYAMQNITYHNSHHEDSKVIPTLAGGFNASLMDQLLAVEGAAQYRQMASNFLGPVSTDNINITGNQAGVGTLSFAPVLNLRLPANTTAKIKYDTRMIEYRQQGMSDTVSYGPTITIGNVVNNSTVFWDLNYVGQTTERDGQPNARREMSNVTIGFPLTARLWFLGNGGHADNHVQTTRMLQNGSYWSAGLRWQPSRRLSLSSTLGPHNKTANIRMVPNERMSLDIAYTDRTIGLTPGLNRRVTGNYQHRQSKWSLGYSETVTNNLIVLTDNAAARGQDQATPVTDMPGYMSEGRLVNEDFYRKRLDVSVALFSNKGSKLEMSVFSERRYYEISATKDRTLGGSSSLSWVMGPRTNFKIAINALHSSYSGLRSDDIFFGSIKLSRRLWPNLTGDVELRQMRRQSDVKAAAYQENRAMAGINMTF